MGDPVTEPDPADADAAARLEAWGDACESQGLPRSCSPEKFVQHHRANAAMAAHLAAQCDAVESGQIMEGRYTVGPAVDGDTRREVEAYIADLRGCAANASGPATEQYYTRLAEILARCALGEVVPI